MPETTTSTDSSLRKTILAIGAIAAVVLLAVFALRNSSPPEAARIREILVERSPDDFTADNAAEIKGIARKCLAGLRLDVDSAKPLIRAFTFGRGDVLGRDYNIASNLVAKTVNRNSKQANDPELMFLRATIAGRTAVSEEEVEDANRLLDQAAMAGSFEARTKQHQGGFFLIKNDPLDVWLENLSRISSAGLRPVAGTLSFIGPTMGGLGVGPLKAIALGFIFDKLRGTKEERTADFLRKVSDNCDMFLANPNILLLKYDCVRTASALNSALWSGMPDDRAKRQERISMLMGLQGGPILGSSKMEPYRSVIFCTEKPCLLFSKLNMGIKSGYGMATNRIKSMFDGTDSAPLERVQTMYFDGLDCNLQPHLPDFLVMPAGDIECYNEEILKLYPNDANKTLVFEPGHPRNGCSYVQHPNRKNEYCELSGFHWRMLREKADELRRVLQSLGATKIALSVLDNSGTKKEKSEDIEASFSAKYKGIVHIFEPL